MTATLERTARSTEIPSPDSRWVRPALLGLLTMTAVLYLWDLAASAARVSARWPSAVPVAKSTFGA